MKIGMRLGVAFGCVLLLMAIIIATGVSRLRSAGQITDRILSREWTKTVVANDVIDLVNDNARASMELALTTDKRTVAELVDRINHNKAGVTEKLGQLD